LNASNSDNLCFVLIKNMMNVFHNYEYQFLNTEYNLYLV